MPEDMDKVRRIFKPIEVGVTALLGNDYPDFLVLYSVRRNKFHIYDMQKQVIPLVQGVPVGFTIRSANIEIGDYIVLQRKGSDKGDSAPNDIQTKMRVK